jgi:hypothetical protein
MRDRQTEIRGGARGDYESIESSEHEQDGELSARRCEVSPQRARDRERAACVRARESARARARVSCSPTLRGVNQHGLPGVYGGGYSHELAGVLVPAHAPGQRPMVLHTATGRTIAV